MKIYKMKNYAEMSRQAANLISAQIIMKPNSVLGLATGSTPIGTYEQLVEWYQKGDLDFSEIITVNLDEYKGIKKENKNSYAYFMKVHLFDKVNIQSDRTHFPDNTLEDNEQVCNLYEEQIRRLGVDLQLLGIGHNGHIGFNEPSDCFTVTTHCVDLQKSTLEANKRFFENASVPEKAFTMGIGTILAAKKILMIVNGEDKSEIVKKAFCGPVTPSVPASILQLHPDVTLIADEAALSKFYEAVHL